MPFRVICTILIVITSFLVAVTVSSAQEVQKPTQVAAEPVAPNAEVIQAWFDLVRLAAQQANADCQKIESVKQLNTVRNNIQNRIEQRMPGFTVDWSAYKVVEKKPAPVVKQDK
jgi:hypothetical protein